MGWVLGSIYSATPDELVAMLDDLLIAQIAASHGSTHTVSFDKAAVRGAGMTLMV